jgi:tetratricopeptide (TPR) repeat protein
MERREVLLKCMGGASVALFPSSRPPALTGAKTKTSPDFDQLMDEARAACYVAWSRWDFGYAIPYLDRAWAEVLQVPGSSARAAILEERTKLLESVSNAEEELPRHRAAVQAEPSNWDVGYWMAFALRRAGRNDEALHQFLTVAATPGSQHDCLNEIGWCYYHKGMYEEARRCFEKTKIKAEDELVPVRGFSDLMRVLENKMLVYAELGLHEQGESTAKEYIRRYGRIEFPERRALKKLGIEADAMYLDRYARSA